MISLIASIGDGRPGGPAISPALRTQYLVFLLLKRGWLSSMSRGVSDVGLLGGRSTRSPAVGVPSANIETGRDSGYEGIACLDGMGWGSWGSEAAVVWGRRGKPSGAQLCDPSCELSGRKLSHKFSYSLFESILVIAESISRTRPKECLKSILHSTTFIRVEDPKSFQGLVAYCTKAVEEAEKRIRLRKGVP